MAGKSDKARPPKSTKTGQATSLPFVSSEERRWLRAGKPEENLVELRLSTSANSLGASEVPVNVRVAFQPITVQGAEISYTLQFKEARLSLRFSGLEEADHSVPYEYKAPSKTISESVKHADTQKAGYDFGMGGKIGGKIAGIEVSVQAHAGRQVGREDAHHLERKPQTYVIKYQGKNQWRIGDPLHGDPGAVDMFLDGMYFTEEAGSAQAQGKNTLMTLKSQPNTVKWSVIAELSVPVTIKSCSIQPIELDRDKPRNLDQTERAKVIDAFCSRLETIKLAKAISADGHLTIARDRLDDAAQPDGEGDL